ncbi:MAG: GNAT family N-acetyltransferase [Planctomycetota bacterium]|nr:MAG: GNAT family N-acetyltransferase [Planctomycetota bacterium]
MIRMQRASAGPFSLASPDSRGRPSKVRALVHRSLERALGLAQLDREYQRMLDRAAEPPDAADFARTALDVLGVEVEVADADLELVPRRDAAIVVSNHPFGGVDGIALAALLTRRRPDVKLLANALLARIEELRPLLIFVDAFGGRDAAARNAAGLREALRWLQDGHLLAVFPAGEVSSLSLCRRRVVDRAWNPAACRLAERTGAPLVPAHVVGRNRGCFQIAGLVHPRLRTVLLPRELLAKRGAHVEVRFGAPVPAEVLRALPAGVDATAHVRRRVEWLRQRGAHVALAPRAQVALERPVPPAVIAAELDALTAARCLAKSGDLQVLLARGSQIPRTLVELGRLREATFREVGEGTGRALDLDAFDEHYLHLVLWSPTERAIAGAYRCAYTEDVLRARGHRGLYTSTLFDYEPRFFARLGPALELGRSFIVPSRQRSFAPLMLLWKGIGSLVLARPATRTLFGAVSISARYHPRSRHLIAHWLRAQRLASELAPLVRARTPLPERGRGRGTEQLLAGVGADWERLAALIGDVEPDRRGLPVLVREYLELGGRFAAFNRDAEFSDVLDGLVVVDLPAVPERVLGRYLGREQARAWLAERAADAMVSARVLQTS